MTSVVSCVHHILLGLTSNSIYICGKYFHIDFHQFYADSSAPQGWVTLSMHGFSTRKYGEVKAFKQCGWELMEKYFFLLFLGGQFYDIFRRVSRMSLWDQGPFCHSNHQSNNNKHVGFLSFPCFILPDLSLLLPGVSFPINSCIQALVSDAPFPFSGTQNMSGRLTLQKMSGAHFTSQNPIVVEWISGNWHHWEHCYKRFAYEHWIYLLQN